MDNDKKMKTLNEILSESLLDADFDVSVEDVYADNIVRKVIELISTHRFKSYDKTVKELYNLLKDAAREQHNQNISTIQKLRLEDNTKIYIQKPAPNHICLNIRRFAKQPRLSGLLVELSSQVDGSCKTFIYTRNGDDMPKILSPEMKETIVFLAPGAWDEIETAYKKDYYGRK